MEKLGEVQEDWSEQIKELQSFFDGRELPLKINLNSYTIVGVAKSVERHMSMVVRNNGNPTFKPYLERLIMIKTILEK